MASTIQDWARALLDPSPLGLVIAVLLVVSIPIFLHSVVFRASGLVTLPSILLLGPSDSGKTSLLTLFERGANAPTHTSQTPIAVECHLPVGTTAKSDSYRSSHDPSSIAHKKFLLVDTPGHGKLRHHALESINSPQNLKGLIFVVDAAALSAGDDGLRQTADYLHEVLLLLQKRSGMKSVKTKEMHVLVAANKTDLFTALPVALVKSVLEGEIAKVRVSRSKGLLDSGIRMGEVEDEENDDWLGEMGSTEFTFAQMEEFDVYVQVVGGCVEGTDGPVVDKWWRWISDRL
ncbi:uncharacterized protein L3040_007043 [Drepanopeziza brunnea f. sp. 'multigermtubi']|uniref:Signal recognition particle receptor subunit beta n=1 Tax=Marssonina brunnea f. sp. multigermtubi (strain MB_m1) TaxID=1072389 RepID=K1WJ29_MARBU|nr:signal recognition particle receptor beta subunit [Drepanopeziza brunnea f. sp. 'multigermtubi' MB_m1]EKD12886.1 signal recognition particle receptor beta subunit [Drepanopeziza brunnea f. sp. 'multigermtubi' MB_m1]KAJ5038175.1 hypothetical protein L3040_007043 [Drepanopeziza brunnea f. sp. 'multigermtubi']